MAYPFGIGRLFTLVLLLAVCGQAFSAQRNIVLYVSDDHGCDAGCYGNPVIKTPNLDRLAEDGLVFDRAFCTSASCSSSRAVILTGQHSHTNGQYGLSHRPHSSVGHPDLRSLSTLLSEAGYRTGRVGKYHVTPAHCYPFDEVVQANDRNPVAMVRAMREFLSAQSDQPFFAFIATSDPHRSHGYKESELRPNLFGNEYKFDEVEEVAFDPADVIVPAFLPDTPATRAELAEYYQSVSRVDQGIGELIATLKELGLWESTLVIYISDHGMPMQGAKTTLYEPGMRSPCVVRDPYASSRGKRTDAMISWTDLTPTLIDFATGDIEGEETTLELPDFEGRSFLPLLRGDPDFEARDTVYGSHTFHEVTMYYPMRVVREERFKLIWNIAHRLEWPSAMDLWDSGAWQAQYRQGLDAPWGVRTVGQYLHRPEFELYDVQSDPDESTNLIDDERYAAEAQRLKQRLRDFQEETADPWLIKWEYE